MSECLHCEIHELLNSELEGKEANLAEIAAKVTEVLADIIVMAPPQEQAVLMADILANLGSFVLEKKEDADPTKPRRSSH
jgi:phenylpyruvate tautomerase PptA (4-oxalocrotonate tautomerase family)